MPQILVEKKHKMTVDKARKAMVDAFAKDLGDFDLQAKWNGMKCELWGKGVTGEVRIEPSRVVFQLTVSIMARGAGYAPEMLEAEIRKRMDSALA